MLVLLLPGPPRTPVRTDGSRCLTNRPDLPAFAGFSRGSSEGVWVSAYRGVATAAIFDVRSLGPPNPFLAPASVATPEIKRIGQASHIDGPTRQEIAETSDADAPRQSSLS